MIELAQWRWRRRLRRVAAAAILCATIGATSVAVRNSAANPPEPMSETARRWLPLPLRLVDTDVTHGNELAASLREAGFGVDVFNVRDIPNNADGGVWWFTNASLSEVPMARLDGILATGGRLLLDGQSTASEALLGVRPARGTSRSAKMDGATVQWDAPIANAVPSTKPGDEVLARTAGGIPALLRRGNVLWSLPRLDRGAGLRRLPYLPNALRALGLEPRAERNDLELYVDPDLEFPATHDDLARRWSMNGISRVYVSAWKHNRLTNQKFDYGGFITAMHSREIEVFAWLEWPHVNFSFFDQHPDCREITATGKPAEIFWREHVALELPRCFDIMFAETREILDAFDFDGINLAELYFESVGNGPLDPDTYTPFHPDTRRMFETRFGWDPKLLFVAGSAKFWKTNRSAFDQWVAWRTQLVTDLHAKAIDRLSRLKAGRRLMLTVIDDRLDPNAGKDPAGGVTLARNIGLDSRAILALRRTVPFEVQIEDPYVFWAGPPRRFAEFGRLYGEVASDQLILDINVVDRGTGLPEEITTAKSRGVELYSSVAAVGTTRARLALYASKTIAPIDFPWLKFALAGGSAAVREESGMITTDAVHAFSLRLVRPARAILLDGERTPLPAVRSVLIPAGRHVVEFEG